MAAKAVDARKSFNRNHRFRGHGPLLQKRAHCHSSCRIHGGIYKGSSPCSYTTRAPRRGPPAREAGMARSYKSSPISTARAVSTGGHTRGPPLVRTPRGHPAAGHRPGRRAWPHGLAHRHGSRRINGGYTRGPPLVRTTCGQAAAGHRPERRPWAAPTKARSVPGVGWSIHHPCRRGPCPRKRLMRGNASTGTTAFAAMGRSYKRSPIATAKGPSPCSYDLRPSRRGPPAREAAMGRSYKSSPIATAHGASTGDIQGALPLLVTPRGHPQRAVRPERGPSPCSYDPRPSRRGPPAREAAHGRESDDSGRRVSWTTAPLPPAGASPSAGSRTAARTARG